MESVTRRTTMTVSGVWVRGALYVGAAMLNDIYAFLTSDAVPRWSVIVCKLALTCVITVRTFIDQSPTQQTVAGQVRAGESNAVVVSGIEGNK